MNNEIELYIKREDESQNAWDKLYRILISFPDKRDSLLLNYFCAPEVYRGRIDDSWTPFQPNTDFGTKILKILVSLDVLVPFDSGITLMHRMDVGECRIPGEPPTFAYTIQDVDKTFYQSYGLTDPQRIQTIIDQTLTMAFAEDYDDCTGVYSTLE